MGCVVRWDGLGGGVASGATATGANLNQWIIAASYQLKSGRVEGVIERRVVGRRRRRVGRHHGRSSVIDDGRRRRPEGPAASASAAPGRCGRRQRRRRRQHHVGAAVTEERGRGWGRGVMTSLELDYSTLLPPSPAPSKLC